MGKITLSDDLNFIGAAAEYFVASDLWRRGIRNVPTNQNMEFDLIAFAPNPIRVQVKGTSSWQNRQSGEPKYRNNYDRYRFDCSRSRKQYTEVDIFALVALDRLAIMYVPFTGQKYYIFKPEDFDAPMLAEVSWFYCMERLNGEKPDSD